MKKWLLAFILFFPVALFAKPLFTNMIIFGDSLSDAGNVPERPIPYKTTPPKQLADLTQDFYVPISNPIDLNGYHVSIVAQFKLNHAPYAWPQLSGTSLLLDQPTINNQPRAFRSMNWPYFLISDAYQDQLTQSHTLLPSMILYYRHIKADIHTSVDYAFASAMSTDRCANLNYIAQNNCDRNTITTAWDTYVNDRSEKNRANFHVPGSLEQVNLFLEDVQNGTVQVGPDTVYTLWVGGNDLAADASEFEKTHNIFIKMKMLSSVLFGIVWNNYDALNKLLSNPNVKAKHIYLFTLFDTATVAPGMQDWSKAMKDANHVAVWAFAHGLNLVVDLLQHHYKEASIHIVPTMNWYTGMAKNVAPYTDVFDPSKLAKACEFSSTAYTQATPPSANCQGYIFWNQLHPSSSANQFVGYQAEQLIKSTYNTQTKIDSSSLPKTGADKKAYIKKQIQQIMLKSKPHAP